MLNVERNFRYVSYFSHKSKIFITIIRVRMRKTHLYKICDKKLGEPNEVLHLLLKNLFYELNKKIF